MLTPTWMSPYLWSYWCLVVLFVIGFIVYNHWRQSRVARVKSVAKQVSEEKWYVTEVAIYDKKKVQYLNDARGWREFSCESSYSCLNKEGGEVKLRSVYPYKNKVLVSLDPGHESIAALHKLAHLQIVEFEFVDNPREDQVLTNTASYLRIKV